MKTKKLKPLPVSVRRYLSAIGRVGGARSRRALTATQSKEMLLVREARRAFKRFQAHCFWSYDPNLKISLGDVPWVITILMKNGNREAWEVARRLCR